MLKGQEDHSHDLETLQRLARELSTEQRTVSESIDALRGVFDKLRSTLEGNNLSRILDALRILEMDARYDQISDAAANTFKWLMESQEVPEGHLDTDMSLATWLREGNGVFHICAKPGAGKSTLMKFLTEDDQEETHLQAWADGKQLITANMFIWKAGSPIQRSFDGFTRALLYQILTHRALDTELLSLLPSLLPNHWRPHESQNSTTSTPIKINPNKILLALDNLIKSEVLAAKFRFCFFVDGLDEFDDPVQKHDMIAGKLLSWTRTEHGNVKFCVSSREENAFLDVLQSHQRLRLHLVTRNDIRTMVRHRLDQHRTFRGYSVGDSEGICEQIVRRAEGVFLWVKLVLDEIWHDLEGLKSAAELRDTLNGVPDEFEALFERAWTSIPTRYLEEAHAVFLLICEESLGFPGIGWNLPSAYLCSFIGDILGSSDFPDDLQVRKRTKIDPTERLRKFTARLRVLSKGLLEITRSTRTDTKNLQKDHSLDPIFGHHVTPIHWAVKNWVLESPPTALKETMRSLNLQELVVKCYIAHAQQWPWSASNSSGQDESISASYYLWNDHLKGLISWLGYSSSIPFEDEKVMQLLSTLDEALLWNQSDTLWNSSIDLSRTCLPIFDRQFLLGFDYKQLGFVPSQHVMTTLLTACEMGFWPYVSWALEHDKLATLPQAKASMLMQLLYRECSRAHAATGSWIPCLSTILEHGADPNYPVFARELASGAAVTSSPWMMYLESAQRELSVSFKLGKDSFLSGDTICLLLRYNAARDVHWSWMKVGARFVGRMHDPILSQRKYY